MTGPEVLDVSRDAIYTLIVVASPVMLVGLAVGVAISLLQALTQIQEMTIAFVPKILAIFISLLIALPFMAEKMHAVVIIRSGVKSPTAVRKCGFGKTIGARAKPASRQTPTKSAEICRRDTSLHHMMSPSQCLDHAKVTSGYGGNNPALRTVGKSCRPAVMAVTTISDRVTGRGSPNSC